jgi:membrane protein
MIERTLNAIRREVWGRNIRDLPSVHTFGIRTARLLWALGRDILDGQLSLRAMSLVYTTLLALVPMLAFSFSILKAFGVHNQIEPVLDRVLQPLGERGSEVSETIIGFVDNISVGLLGSVGLLILVYVVVSLVQKIEDGFNYAWRVRQARSFASRFSGYLSVLAVGPILVFSAISLIGIARSQTAVAWLLEREPFGTLMVWFTGILPVLLISAAFTLFYILIPNTRVRFVPALVGGLAAGFLWEAVGSLFAAFVVGSGRYTAIYAGFAAPLLFMFWIYLSWLILLIGTQIAFYVQNPQFVAARREPPKMENAFMEHLAMAVMYLVAHSFRTSGPSWTFDALSRRLHVRPDPLRTVVDRLVESGLLTAAGDRGDTFAPGRATDTISLHQIIDATRHGSGLAGHGGVDVKPLPAVDAIQAEVDTAVRKALEGQTLHDLVTRNERS